jgi:hypothetical protein
MEGANRPEALLRALNHLSDRDALKPGERIKIVGM